MRKLLEDFNQLEGNSLDQPLRVRMDDGIEAQWSDSSIMSPAKIGDTDLGKR